MTILESGSSAVLSVFAFDSVAALSEIANSAGKSGKQQINNLWPCCFVKDTIYEKRARNIPEKKMLMLVKDDCGEATA